MESFDLLCKCHHIPPNGKFVVGKLYKWTVIIDGIAVYDDISELIPFSDIEFLWYFSKQ